MSLDFYSVVDSLVISLSCFALFSFKHRQLVSSLGVYYTVFVPGRKQREAWDLFPRNMV